MPLQDITEDVKIYGDRWEWRVIQHSIPSDYVDTAVENPYYFTLGKVWFEENGDIQHITSLSPVGDSMEELRQSMATLNQAFDKLPVDYAKWLREKM